MVDELRAKETNLNFAVSSLGIEREEVLKLKTELEEKLKAIKGVLG
jgi:hypothetical protein